MPFISPPWVTALSISWRVKRRSESRPSYLLPDLRKETYVMPPPNKCDVSWGSVLFWSGLGASLLLLDYCVSLSWKVVGFHQMPFLCWYNHVAVFPFPLHWLIFIDCHLAIPMIKSHLAMVCHSFYTLLDCVHLVFCWGFKHLYL